MQIHISCLLCFVERDKNLGIANVSYTHQVGQNWLFFLLLARPSLSEFRHQQTLRLMRRTQLIATHHLCRVSAIHRQTTIRDLIWALPKKYKHFTDLALARDHHVEKIWRKNPSLLWMFENFQSKFCWSERHLKINFSHTIFTISLFFLSFFSFLFVAFHSFSHLDSIKKQRELRCRRHWCDMRWWWSLHPALLIVPFSATHRALTLDRRKLGDYTIV